MGLLSRHKRHIIKKLTSVDIKEIRRVKRLPSGIRFFTWSAGPDIEADYNYKITSKNDEEIYGVLTTFLGVIIFQSHFFKEIQGQYRIIA